VSGGTRLATDPLPPPPDPRWELGPPGDPEEVSALTRELNLPAPMCRVLAARGLGSPSEARAFLRPLLEHLHPAESLRDGERAALRILRAIAEGETIFVHGDYDVDGVCSTALLTGVFGRLRDGYDLGPTGVEAARDAGASLLVTVDCGSRALEAVREATASGMDVIVTDHHVPGDELPEAFAFVNPHRPDATYPNPHLCGTGVAYKLAQLVARGSPGADPVLQDELDLVALATVADLVPLEGENRTLVRFGLKVVAEGRRPGLAALLTSTGLRGKEISAGRVGFVLGPRLNAAGRVGETRMALDLLLTQDPAQARVLAEALEQNNATRQEEDRRTLDEALEQLARDYDPDSDFGVVIAGEGWHPGVIGIVASRVVERIHRPSVLVSVDGDMARGSARSIPGFHLLEAVTACAPHLQRFGGHRQAAGMDLRTDEIQAFREAFRREARARLSHGDQLRPVIRGDILLDVDEISPELVRYLTYMGPFGIRNRRPVFFAREVMVEGAREVGSGHLKVRLGRGRRAIDGIGFGLARRLAPDRIDGRTMDAAFHLEENTFRGRTSIQARLLDLREAGEIPDPAPGLREGG
jgi:single-stranded-DNA-specific exonuclease